MCHNSCKYRDVKHVPLSDVSSPGGPYVKSQELMNALDTSVAETVLSETVFVHFLYRSLITNRYSFLLRVRIQYPRLSMHTDASLAFAGNLSLIHI